MAKEKTTKQRKHKNTAAAAASKKRTVAKKTPIKPASKQPVKAPTAAAPIVKAEKKADKSQAIAASRAARLKAILRPKKADGPTAKLLKWYKWLGALLIIEGLVIAILGNSKVTSPVTLPYPAVDTLASEAAGREVIGGALRHMVDLQLMWVVAAALVIFAVAYFLTVTSYRARFEQIVQTGVNPLRAFALGVGGGVAVIATALLSGVHQGPLLVFMFLATCAAAALGLAAEKVVAVNNGVKTRFARLMCSLALISALAPWVVFALGVLGAVLWGGSIPGYLYTLYACQALFALALLLATHFRLGRKGKWADGLYAERGFMLLGFLMVSVLAWQIFFGALQA